MQILDFADWFSIPAPGAQRTWTDYDLDNASCPADTIGAILQIRFYTSGGSNDTFRLGVRPNGSTDDGNYFYKQNKADDTFDYQYPVIVGCDANKIIELYWDETASRGNEKLYIVGWIQSGDGHMLTNAVGATYLSAQVDDSWNEVHFDSAIQGGDTPQAWAVRICNSHWSHYNYQARPTGSTFNYQANYVYDTAADSFVGVGTNNRLDIYLGDLTDPYVCVRGYLTSGYTSRFDNPVLYDPTAQDTWETVTLSALPAEVIGIFESDSSAAGSRVGVRQVGSADTFVPKIGGGPAIHFIKLDANKQVQAYERYSGSALVLTGYLEPVTATPPSSYDDQTYYFDQAITPLDLSVGWTDADPNGFTADQLPSGLTLSAQGVLTGTPVCPPGQHNPVARPLYGQNEVQSGAVVEVPPLDLTAGSLQGDTEVQSGAVVVSAPASYELNFNQTYINTGLVLDPQSAYTIECEVKSTSDAGGYIGNFLGVSLDFFLQFRDTGLLRAQHWGGKDADVSNTNWTVNTLHTVVCKLPGSSGDMNLTVDGSGGTKARGSVSSNSSGLALGAYQESATANSMVGVLKNVKIWSGDKDSGGTLIHHWKIDDNSTTIVDSVGTANGTLTIGNGSWSQV